MPARYQGHRLPAILYAQPFDFVIAAACILSAVRIFFNSDATPWSIEELPDLLGLLYRFILFLAGVFILAGLLRWSHRWASSLEQSGMWLAATAFSIYGVTLATSTHSSPRATLAILLIVFLAAACILRARALAIDARAQLQALREAPRKDCPDE